MQSRIDGGGNYGVDMNRTYDNRKIEDNTVKFQSRDN